MVLESLRGRSGAVLWVLTLQFFLAEQLVQHAWRAPVYDFAHNYVSDLGAVFCSAKVCSPLHGLMNASFILQGLLIATGALLLRRRFAPWRGYSLGITLCVMCGVGVTVVGLAPEDAAAGVHVAGATAHFLCGGLAMLAMGTIMLWDLSRNRTMGWASVIAGFIVLGATVLLGLRGKPMWNELGLEIGWVERVPAYAIPLWFAGMGASLLLLRRNASAS